MERKIFNGISWYDQKKNPVNAHGACIIQEKEKYYLFGEYKTDDVNKYIGFSCYSTENFTNSDLYRRSLVIPASGIGGNACTAAD